MYFGDNILIVWYNVYLGFEIEGERIGMEEIKLTHFESFIRNYVQHYNGKKYWKYREQVLSYHGGKINKITCTFKLLYIKRCDAFNNATTGTHLGFGAEFATPPYLPHGLYGIVVSHNAVIGKKATIYHQVTIGAAGGGAPVIGDNVYIGAGAKIIGKIRIGDNVRIGAGCVVTADIPNNCTVVSMQPRIIVREDRA